MTHKSDVRRIAGVTMESLAKDLDGNTAKVKSHMKHAKDAGAKLVLFPEMCLTGYLPDAGEVAIEADSPILSDLAGEADRLGIAVSVGFVEDAGDKKHVAQAFLYHGQIQSIYRKIYPCETGTSVGEDFQLVDWDGIPLGTIICRDLHFPSVVREYAKRGVLIVLHPAAYRDKLEDPFEIDNHNVYIPRTRAKENGVFLFSVNASGLPRQDHIHFGNAILVGPDGRILARVDRSPCSETMLVADIDLEEARNASSRSFVSEEHQRCGLTDRVPSGGTSAEAGEHPNQGAS